MMACDTEPSGHWGKVQEIDHPWPLVVVDDFLQDTKLLEKCVAEWPWAVSSPDVTRYNNDCEHLKVTCNQRDVLPGSIREMLGLLTCKPMIDRLASVMRLPPLAADPELWGAGLHVLIRNGYLQPHVDFAIHPNNPQWERRLNLIMFLNDSEDGGGEFVAYDHLGRARTMVKPKLNRVVLFDPVEDHRGLRLHGTGLVRSRWRASIAVYYMAQARPTTARRSRALFVPWRGPEEYRRAHSCDDVTVL